VIGLSYSGIGVQGASFDNSGSGIGGSFASYAADGKGVIGSADDGIGVYGESLHGTGVYGETGSADGYGGYFVGRLYCNDYVGFGIVNPTYRLHLPNTANPAGKGYANAWISASSRRWKENIETIPDALDKVQRLRGVVFDWKPEQGGTHDLGFIAEEVSEVVPELAELEADGTATGIKYDRVTALLVEAVKDQQRVIDQQREQLAGLMTQLTEMQKRLAALESKSSPTTPRR
jgi:uncharacterized coiled-coil protein SlyX